MSRRQRNNPTSSMFKFNIDVVFYADFKEDGVCERVYSFSQYSSALEMPD